eukprot:UN07627
MNKRLISRFGYSARVLSNPSITHNRALLCMQPRRTYYKWLFGWDDIDDSLKRTPRSFWVRLSHELWTCGALIASGCAIYITAVSDTERF